MKLPIRVIHLCTPWNQGMQYCYNIAILGLLGKGGLSILKAILGEGFSGKGILLGSVPPKDVEVVEIGPRLNFATPYSTNLVSVCRAAGLTEIIRAERSQRYQLPLGADRDAFIAAHHDRMTECVYPEPIR
jgi:phosphoribosylformylglycinamidine synthase